MGKFKNLATFVVETQKKFEVLGIMVALNEDIKNHGESSPELEEEIKEFKKELRKAVETHITTVNSIVPTKTAKDAIKESKEMMEKELA